MNYALRCVRARSARIAGRIFEDSVSDLQHAAACDVLRRRNGAVPAMGCS